ncbi:hypothetical protein DYB28_005131 [Aphanomyces astaci]|uniref:Uncharacterized protein n=2 Tax=Aphanomyces astaci TaxID=112090 RepID=A0A9X8DXZ6_APHAT|nr:hypothetical protein DYB28_005131 [Aphanomyces astaci]
MSRGHFSKFTLKQSMHFRARLVLKVDGKLKQSKKSYDLLVDKNMVCFKDSGTFKRSFPKPDTVVVGKHVARIQQGSRYFLCRFPDRPSLLRCVAMLGEMGVTIVDYYDLTHQDSTKQLRVAYCVDYMGNATQFTQDSRDVQSSLHRALFDPTR